MEKVLAFAHELYQNMGLEPTMVRLLSLVSLFLIVAICLWLIYICLSKVIEPFIYAFTRRTEIKWDDIVFRHKFLRWVWALVVSIIAYIMLPPAFADYPTFSKITLMLTRIALISSIMMLAIEGVRSLFMLVGDRENIGRIVQEMHQAIDADSEYVYTPSHSLKGLQQMLTILIVGLAIVLMVSTLVGRDPLIILSGLSAMAAVLMLVFQDSILGMVAGVQITANDMLQPGDWIMAPKYGANGIVKEVTLAAVKVQNWDKTIITVPPYKLLTEGFQNWRGMLLSKGRRVCRSINIDMHTVRYATQDEIYRWRSEKWWAEVNAPERVVNLTVFRMYLEHYLTTVPTFVPHMLFMIRELQPTPEGLPIEIYFFTSNTEWKRYERVQADVIDQVLAMLPEFGLRVFQTFASKPPCER